MNTEAEPQAGVYEVAVKNLLHGDRPPILHEQARAIVDRLLRASTAAVGDNRKQAFVDAADIIANEFLAAKPEPSPPAELAEKLLSPVEYMVDTARHEEQAADMHCRFKGPFARLCEAVQAELELVDEPDCDARLVKCRRATMSEYVDLVPGMDEQLRIGIEDSIDEILSAFEPPEPEVLWHDWDKKAIRLSDSFMPAFLRLLDQHAKMEVRRVLNDEEADRLSRLRTRLELQGSPGGTVKRSDVLRAATEPGERIPLAAVKMLQHQWCEPFSCLNDLGQMSDGVRFSVFYATLIAWLHGFEHAGGIVENEWSAVGHGLTGVAIQPPVRQETLFFARDEYKLSKPFESYEEAEAASRDGKVYAGRRVRLSEALEAADYTRGGEATPSEERAVRGHLESAAARGSQALNAQCPGQPFDLPNALALEKTTRYPKLGVLGTVVAELDRLVDLEVFIVDQGPHEKGCAIRADFPSEFKGLGDDNA